MFECWPIITVNQANVHISNCNQCSFVCTGLQTADSHMMLTQGTTLRSNTNIVIKEQENELKLQPY